MTIYDHLLVIGFAILYPAWDFFVGYPKFKKRLENNTPNVRSKAYVSSIICIWTFTIMAIFLWACVNRVFPQLGLTFSINWTIWVAIGIAIAGTLYTYSVSNAVNNDEDQRNQLIDKLKAIRANQFLPRTKGDFTWFIFLAISAGICEEILFRGFLMWYIGEFSSVAVAVIISSLVFGLAHSYQGLKGVIQSAGTGVAMALIYVLTKNLWIPIILHIVIDLYMGLLGYIALKEEG